MHRNETDLKVFQKKENIQKVFYERLFQSRLLEVLALTIFPPHFLWCSLSHRGRNCDEYAPTESGFPMMYSNHTLTIEGGKQE